jgi:hypothetical protein
MQLRVVTKFMLLFIFILPVSVWAGGGDTLGNGGGIGELQITQAWSQLDTKVASCFNPSNPCGLSNSDLTELARITSLRQTSKPNLAFVGGSERHVFTVDGLGNVVFSSKALYFDGAHVKPFQILLGYAIASFYVRLNHSYEEALQFGARVSRFWQQTLFAKEGLVGGKPAIIAVSQVLQPSSTSTNLYVQFKDQAWDLTSNVVAAFPCPVNHSTLRILTGVFSSEGHLMAVSGQLSFQCAAAARTFFGNFMIEVDSKSNEAYVDISNVH